MNKITTYGRMASDVEIREVNGRNVANFRMASQNKDKDKNTNQYGTNFYRVTVWGPMADNAAKFLHKGNRVTVSGDLVIRNYKDGNGIDKQSIEIINAEFDLVETKAEAGGAPAQAAPAPAQPYAQPQAPVYAQPVAPAYAPPAQAPAYAAPTPAPYVDSSLPF